jgi:protein-disulfide isomerase
MALWGLLANVAFVALAAWDPLTEGVGRLANRTGLLTIATVLVLATIVMGVISLTTLNTLCPFCLATYALSFLTLAGTWIGYRPNLKPTFKLSFVGVVFGFGIAAFILNDQLRSGYTDGQDTNLRTAAALQDWQQNPKLEIAETDPLATGPSRADAKMTIAEFADFRCIHCKLAAAPIKAFVASHPDVRLEFYSWPLDGECNTSIQQANGASCLLARTVWCARNKAQKGWEAHERVFARFEEWKSTDAVRAGLDSLAKEIGMPADELKTCADSEAAKAAIIAQAQLGSSLNIRGTPAIYANGKLLPAGSSIPSLSAVHATLR